MIDTWLHGKQWVQEYKFAIDTLNVHTCAICVWKVIESLMMPLNIPKLPKEKKIIHKKR